MKSETSIRGFALLATLLGSGQASNTWADDPGASVATPCLVRENIRSTKVLNDRNILFITRDRTIYHNDIGRRCPGMTRATPLSFTYADHRLCSGSTFSVLMRVGSGSNSIAVNDPANNVHYSLPGPNFVQGATCQLRAFAPISEDEVKALTAATNVEHRSHRRSNRDAVKTEALESTPAAQPTTPK